MKPSKRSDDFMKGSNVVTGNKTSSEWQNSTIKQAQQQASAPQR